MSRPPMRRIGTTGLNESGGYVLEEYLPELQGERGRRVIHEMTTMDPTIGGVLMAIRSLLTQVNRDVIPADQSQEALRAADLVKTALQDMSTPFESLMSEILTMLPYGWAYFEIIYKHRVGERRDPEKSSFYSDGAIGWADWSIRSQTSLSRWGMENGRIAGMYQYDGNGSEVFIPMEKAILFRPIIHKNNPEGQSILRNAYRPWYFKKHIETIEAIGVERDLAGLPVGKIPSKLFDDKNRSDEDTATYNAIKDIVTKIRRDEQEGVLWPSDRDANGQELYDLELLASPGQRQFETGAVIERYDTRILMSVLADFIMLGHEQVGSFALSSDKTNLFAVALGAFNSIIDAIINRGPVRQLLRFNGISIQLAPRVHTRDIETANLENLGQFVYNLARSGILLNDIETEDYLRGQANLPTNSDMERQGKSLTRKEPQPVIEEEESDE